MCQRKPLYTQAGEGRGFLQRGHQLGAHGAPTNPGGQLHRVEARPPPIREFSAGVLRLERPTAITTEITTSSEQRLREHLTEGLCSVPCGEGLVSWKGETR